MVKDNWFKRHPIWSGVIGFFLLMLLIWMFIPEDNSNDENKIDIGYKINKIDACYMSHEFINQKLKSPYSAEYENCYYADVVYIGNQTYEVYSYVDSQNGFGAMIRNNYWIQLKDNQDDTWSGIDYMIY